MAQDDHEVGKRQFAERLRSTTKQCPACGFEATVLDSPWKTETHTDIRSGHVRYELTCPDCNETVVLEVNLP